MSDPICSECYICYESGMKYKAKFGCSHTTCVDCLRGINRQIGFSDCQEISCPFCRKKFESVSVVDGNDEDVKDDCISCGDPNIYRNRLDCGHAFCFECLEFKMICISKVAPKCPVCLKKGTKVRRDMGITCDHESDRMIPLGCGHKFCWPCLSRWFPREIFRCPNCGEDGKCVKAPDGMCSLCYDKLEEPIKLRKCRHEFCYSCIKAFTISPIDLIRMSEPHCPVCQAKYTWMIPRETDYECVICFGEIDPENRGISDGCGHFSCYSCLEKRSEVSKCCPKCEETFSKIYHIEDVTSDDRLKANYFLFHEVHGLLYSKTPAEKFCKHSDKVGDETVHFGWKNDWY